MSAIKLIVDADYAKFDSGMAHVEAAVKRAQATAFSTSGILSGGSAIDRAATARFDQEQASRDRRARSLRAERRQERISAWREETEAMRMSGGVSASSFSAAGGAANYRGARHRGAIGGASSAMFVSVARDTAASLASGANPITVFMQQAPQVLQAMTMMGRSLASLLPIIGGVGAALLAAFATHVVSKGIAGMIYGLDKLDSEGEKLKSKATIFRKLREEMEAAAKAATDWAAALSKVKAESLGSRDKKRSADLDAYREELLKQDREERARGGSGRGQRAIDIMVAEKAVELAKSGLKDVTEAKPFDEQTERMKIRRKELAAISIDKKTEAEYDEQMMLDEAISESEKAFETNRTTQIKEANTAVLRAQSALDELLNPQGAAGASAQAGAGSVGPLTAAQRSGHDVIGPTISMLDIQKQHLNVSREGFRELIDAVKGGKLNIGAYFGQ